MLIRNGSSNALAQNDILQLLVCGTLTRTNGKTVASPQAESFERYAARVNICFGTWFNPTAEPILGQEQTRGWRRPSCVCIRQSQLTFFLDILKGSLPPTFANIVENGGAELDQIFCEYIKV